MTNFHRATKIQNLHQVCDVSGFLILRIFYHHNAHINIHCRVLALLYLKRVLKVDSYHSCLKYANISSYICNQNLFKIELHGSI